MTWFSDLFVIVPRVHLCIHQWCKGIVENVGFHELGVKLTTFSLSPISDDEEISLIKLAFVSNISLFSLSICVLIYFLINNTVKIFVGACQESVGILDQGPYLSTVWEIMWLNVYFMLKLLYFGGGSRFAGGILAWHMLMGLKDSNLRAFMVNAPRH